MKWQNLKTGKCPECGGPLNRTNSKGIHSCRDCDFKISEDRIIEIFSDPVHPINKYQNAEARTEVEELALQLQN